MSTPAKTCVVLLLIAGAFLAGYRVSRTQPPLASASHPHRVLYHTCPMHPYIRSERPGDAPCCGMRLVPVYADEDRTGALAGFSPGSVEIGPAEQQLMGVRLGSSKSVHSRTRCVTRAA